MTVALPVAWAHGDRNEHLVQLDAEVEAAPESVPHLLERAAAHRRLGDYEASLADLDLARAVSPGNHRVDYLSGLTHLRRGDFKEAEAALRRYLDAVPTSASGHTTLAETLTAQGRHLDAAREYSLAIAAQPTPIPDHFLARAKALRAAGTPHLDVAVAGLDEGMSAMGPLVTLQRLAVQIELDRGNHAGAIDRIDAVLAKAPRKETWLVTKGTILASIDREREAADAFRLAKAAVNSLPTRIRSSTAMLALRETIANHLNKDMPP